MEARRSSYFREKVRSLFLNYFLKDWETLCVRASGGNSHNHRRDRVCRSRFFRGNRIVKAMSVPGRRGRGGSRRLALRQRCCLDAPSARGGHLSGNSWPRDRYVCAPFSETYDNFPLSTLKCNTGGRQSLSSGRSAWLVSQGAGAAGAFAAGRAYRRRTPPPRRKIPPGPTPGLAGAARRLSMSCDPGTRTGAARLPPGARVALLAAVPQVPVQRSAGLPVVPHVLVDPLVADPALKAQSPRDLLRTPLQSQLFLDFAPPLRGHLPAPCLAAALGRQPVGLIVATPARVAGQFAADHRVVAAELLPDSGVRRFSSGPGNVPGRSGDDSLWANLRFALTEIIRIA